MKRSAVPVAVALAGLALVGLLLYGLIDTREDRTIESALARGERPAAPVESLPVLGASGRRSLAAFKGQVVVLNFWASWCEPCRFETPDLEKVHKRISTGRATVLGVNFQDTDRDALAFSREFKTTYPSLRDKDGEYAGEFGTTSLPETFIIDRQGRIAAKFIGNVTQDKLDAALASLL